MTSDQAMTPGGSVSVRVATSLARWALAGRSRMRASRSWSQKTIFGSESFSAYSTSSATHQAFMPTTATPMRDGGPVDEQPFRIVAHGDGDAVAGLDALAQQPGGDGGGAPCASA